MANLSIPAMFTDTHIDTIININNGNDQKYKINEVYGSLPSGPVGTIRPSATLPHFEKDFLFDHIRKLKRNNLNFGYIMNSTVLDGREYTAEGKSEIIEFIGELIDAGIDSLSLSVPFLIRLAKKYYPELNITASICAEVDSVQKAVDFFDLGVECIVPAKDANRDFNVLEKMVDEGRKYNARIKLLATTPCIYKCSDVFYHMNLSSVRDNMLQDAFQVDGKFLSHTTPRCQRRRLENPVEYIRSPWIRPEDIKFYEKIGVEDFKIDGRDKPEEYNLEVASIYSKGSFDGNLLYLMQNYFPKDVAEFERLNSKEPDFWKLGVYMDNAKLNGFLKAFAEKKLRCVNGCTSCEYCPQWADRTIEYDVENTDSYLAVLNRAEEEAFDIKRDVSIRK